MDDAAVPLLLDHDGSGDQKQEDSVFAPDPGAAGRAGPAPRAHPRHGHDQPQAQQQSRDFDSFNFEIPNSLVRQIYVRTRSEADRRSEIVWRWILTFLVAVCIALIAFLIELAIKFIERLKFGLVEAWLGSPDRIAFGVLIYMGMSMALVMIAALAVTYYEPVAVGSGIPEIKCILNGVKIPRAVRLKTLVCKSIGIVFGVASGLPIGREGPMIHIGAVCGAGISQGKSTTLGIDTKLNLFRPFRNDREKRDFIACGTSAGVACAFGAPLGGVLFAIEESSSFWSTALTLRAFFTALSSAFILNILSNAGGGRAGSVGDASTFTFGLFPSFSQSSCLYGLAEVPVFILMGISGGLFGAAFNHCNLALCRWRNRRLNRRLLRLGEAVVFAAFVSLLSIAAPLIATDCIDDGSSGLASSRRCFTCPSGRYSLTATLFFNPAESAVKNLFHSDERFGFLTTAIFSVITYILCCATYGLSIPSGLFVPNLLVGAAFGRLVGEFLNWTALFGEIDSGIYALIGSAAVLGGMARMTISLTVILVEATGNIQYGLPIMVALMFSKWTGDLFNENLYDAHIHLKKLSYLGPSAPPVAEYLIANDIMTHDVVTIKEICKVRDVVEVVLKTPHNCYPVVASSPEHSLDHRGSISRSYLITILIHRDFHDDKPIPNKAEPRLHYLQFEGPYPRYPNIEKVALSEADLNLWIDLTPYMNPSPYVVQEHSPVVHVFDLFRTMGLRHLGVVNRQNQIAGMITRQDLDEVHLKSKLNDLFSTSSSESLGAKLSPKPSVPVLQYALVRDLDKDHERQRMES